MLFTIVVALLVHGVISLEFLILMIVANRKCESINGIMFSQNFSLFIYECKVKGKLLQETWTYQVSPIKAQVGECIRLEARKNFPGYNANSTTVTWKKDSLLVTTSEYTHVDGRRLYISYLRQTDTSFFQAVIEDKVSKLRETTDFWINVKGCGNHEAERPTRTGKCKPSCVEVCPSGWHYVQGVQRKCFKYFSSTVSWKGAQDKCQNLGSQLAQVESAVENSFVGNLLQSGDGAWIGLNDVNSESYFMWNSNKRQTPQYFAWGKGQPDNAKNRCNFENCVEMGMDGRWADTDCTAFRPYVCQKTMSDSSMNGTNGWFCNAKICLKYFSIIRQWNSALKSCHAEGGKLAEVFSDEDNNRVKRMVKSTAWIGLNDFLESGLYIWNDVTVSGKRATYFNWASGQPTDMVYNLLYKNKCSGEDCVQILFRSSVTSWYDAPCSKKLPFICEHLRDSSSSKPAITGIIIGTLIVFAVLAGLLHKCLRTRSRTAVEKMIQHASRKSYTESRQVESPSWSPAVIKYVKHWKQQSKTRTPPKEVINALT